MITAVQKEDQVPVCPHCKLEVGEVWFREISGIFGKRYLYFCAQCRSVLGVSHRKGFWMG